MAGEDIRKMLALRHRSLTQAVVAKTLGVKPATVSRWYAKADKLNLDFGKARTMTAEALEDLFNSKPGPKSSSTWPVDLNKVDFALELGKTIDETYEDYLAEAAKSNCLLQPLKRAAYFARVKKHRDHLKASSRAMMMVWGPGKYMQIDLAGDTILVGPDSDGKITTVTVFVGTLPASGLVFAWALAETTTKDWNEAIAKMFGYIGGVPEIVLCDNAKALVVNATPGCQVFTDDFADLAGKYGFQIECAKPGKPKHKGNGKFWETRRETDELNGNE